MALVPLEEWEKVKPKHQSTQVKVLSVQQKERRLPQERGVTASQEILKKNKHNPTNTWENSTTTMNNRIPQGFKTTEEEMKEKKVGNLVASTSVKNHHRGAGVTMGTDGLRLNQFPPKMRSRARKLIYLLKKSNKIGFNKRFEISISGMTVPDSNILHLIEHALSISGQSNKLKGIHRFYTLLRNIGVPTSLLKNKWGVAFVQKKKNINMPGSIIS